MCGKKILAVAGVVAVLLLITGLLFILVSPAPTFTVRHSQTVRSNDGFLLTFQIANHTPNFYFVEPSEVEANDGGGWKRCFEFSNDTPPLQSSALTPHAWVTYIWKAKNLPPGCPLRVKIRFHKGTTGLEGFIMRLWLQHRVSVPLNPFVERSKVFGLPTEVASDEFTEPAPPASTEPAADSPGSK